MFSNFRNIQEFYRPRRTQVDGMYTHTQNIWCTCFWHASIDGKAHGCPGFGQSKFQLVSSDRKWEGIWPLQILKSLHVDRGP